MSIPLQPLRPYVVGMGGDLRNTRNWATSGRIGLFQASTTDHSIELRTAFHAIEEASCFNPGDRPKKALLGELYFSYLGFDFVHFAL